MFLSSLQCQSIKEKTKLQQYTGKIDSKEIVAQLMIEYNQYFGNLIQGVIRVQQNNFPAEYILSTNSDQKLHDSLKITNYTHATSPIRRVVDLINQWCILDPSRNNFCQII